PSPDLICERRENQVHVIGHDHNDAQVVSLGVIMLAAIEHDLSRPFCQDSPILRNECDEVRLAIALQMRQVAAIKGHETLLLGSTRSARHTSRTIAELSRIGNPPRLT